MRIDEVELAMKIFLDLDGVLADFEGGVIKVTGKKPSEQPLNAMWRALARTPDFYATLDWMPDGPELWHFCKKFDPDILTGLPMGGWAPKQKRVWCGQNLGWHITVHTVFARDKYKFAAENHILVDDRKKNIDAWKSAGGIGILHTSAANSIRDLMELGFQ